jgi:hypothetical protein
LRDETTTELGQQLGRGAADAAARAGDDGDLPGEIERGVFHCCCLPGSVIPGLAKREPGIHWAASLVVKWIPGSPLCDAPE